MIIENTNLVFFCSKMPLAEKSSFVDTEIEFLLNHFQSIVIFTSDQSVPIPKNIPNNCKIISYNPVNSLKDNFLLLFILIRKIQLFLKVFSDEISTIKNIYRLKINIHNI